MGNLEVLVNQEFLQAFQRLDTEDDRNKTGDILELLKHGRIDAEFYPTGFRVIPAQPPSGAASQTGIYGI